MRNKESLRNELEKYREQIKSKTKRVASAIANGATIDCSVCAAGFGASLIGQSQQRSTYLKTFKKERKINKALEKARRTPSKRQLAFANTLGISLAGKTRKQASKAISDVVGSPKRK